MRPKPGKDPIRSAKAILNATNRPPRRPNIAREREKRRLAQALLAAFPELHTAQDVSPDASISAGMEEATGPTFRLLELYGRDEDGVTISLDAYTAGVSIAYWHTGAQAAAVLERVRRYLAVLQREGGYAVYDPQEERILDVSHDLQSAQQTFDDVAVRMEDVLTSHLS